MISEDYHRRVQSFLAFTDKYMLPIGEDRDIDAAMTDWGDLEYLCGEGFEAGEKLLAAVIKWALTRRCTGILQLPRFRGCWWVGRKTLHVGAASHCQRSSCGF